MRFGREPSRSLKHRSLPVGQRNAALLRRRWPSPVDHRIPRMPGIVRIAVAAALFPLVVLAISEAARFQPEQEPAFIGGVDVERALVLADVVGLPTPMDRRDTVW